MKTRNFILSITVALVTATTIPTGLAAQDEDAQGTKFPLPVGSQENPSWGAQIQIWLSDRISETWNQSVELRKKLRAR